MSNRRETIEKINAMITDVEVAMLTTVDADGDFHSRPMMTQANEFDGDVWFFAHSESDKVEEIRNNPNVNVAYADDGDYVSIAGTARLVYDVDKKKDLWQDKLSVWFEEGPESDSVVLIHVESKSAQYWDIIPGAIGQMINRAKVALTGDKDAAGDSAKVEF